MGEPAVALRELVKLYDRLHDKLHDKLHGGAPPSAEATPGLRSRGCFGGVGEGNKVLDLPELDLEAGRVHVVVGPNGAGKTTLLRIVNGLERPSSGRVRVLGTEVWSARAPERLELRRRMAFCPEKPYLFQTTVRCNVEYPLRVRGVSAAERRPLSETAMAKLGVGELAGRDARTLSAGETQRVAIARAIASDPEMLLLDEPLANVDARAVPLVEDTVVELASRGVTVVVATHVLDQAYRLSANVVRLEGGRIAPPAVENIMEGEITGEGVSAVLVLDGGTAVHVVTERRGHARASVDPHDIIVSPDEFESSARNLLPARVVSLRERGGLVYVTGLVGADGRSAAEPVRPGSAGRSGHEFVSVVTPESCEKLALSVGSRMIFAFKATAVKIF